jgi:hypothetical protein
MVFAMEKRISETVLDVFGTNIILIRWLMIVVYMIINPKITRQNAKNKEKTP